MIEIRIHNRIIAVEYGTTVAAAMLNAGIANFRISVGGQPRAPLCGMGVCFECRVTINGNSNQRSCTTLCEHGMEIEPGI